MALPILDGNQSATTLSTILTGGAHIPAHTVVSLGSQAITDIANAVSSVQISGTVTATLADQQTDSGTPIFVAAYVSSPGGSAIPVSQDAGAGMPISGTVTANIGSVLGFNEIYLSDADNDNRFSSSNPFPISGTVTANGGNFLNSDDALISKDSASNLVLLGGLNYSATPTQSAIDALRTDGNGQIRVYQEQTFWTDTNQGNQARAASQQTPFPVQVLGGSVTIGSLPAISGTVTVGAMPSGALTTRFGSVTTANLATLTSAVTNTSRKYLLVQNIATSTVTIGIGFAPTTTQGIQLTAGAGLTFDAFCPTGGVWWLSSTTGSNFSILEG